MLQGPTSLPEPPALQRASGCARISVRAVDGRTRLARLYQDGCAKIRLPDGGAGLEAVLINSAGGVTGGDRISWSADAAGGAELTLTTQACEKVYRARDGVALDVCDKYAIEGLLTNRPDIPVTLVTDATRPIHAEQAPALLADWGRRGVTLAASDEILAG
jgi:hypothetical protein